MTTTPEMPTTHSDVLANIRAARAELLASFDGLSAEQMTGPRTDGGWSIKDHLAHVAEWQRRGLGVLDGKPPWEGLHIDKATWDQLENVDDINEVLHQRHKDSPLDQVLEDFHATYRQVERTIESMSDEDLQRELSETISPRYRRVIDIANYNFARHDRAHIDDIRGLVQ